MNLASTSNLSTEQILFAMQQRNLIYNYNFLYYSNQVGKTPVTYNHPDGWQYSDAGSNGEISFDPVKEACLIKKSKGNDMMTFAQAISEFPRWQKALIGQKVSASAVIENVATHAFEVMVSLHDGIASSNKSITIQSNEKKEISIELILNKNAIKLDIAITSSTDGAVIYINKVFANVGDIALDTLPCMVEGFIGERKQYISTNIPPVEELSLCAVSEELPPTFTRLSSFLNGKFGFGKNGLSLLPDMRGYFSRAWDNGALTDPNANSRTALAQGGPTGDKPGTLQEDMFKAHDHGLEFDTSEKISTKTENPITNIINTTLTSKTEKTGGDETRGKNISELYTMKWA